MLGERPYSIKEELNKFVTAGGNPFTAAMGSKESAENEEDSGIVNQGLLLLFFTFSFVCLDKTANRAAQALPLLMQS